MPKFNELSKLRQALTLIAMMLSLGVPIGSGLLWAADARIDKKYATDTDLAAVAVSVSEGFEQLNQKVDEGATALRNTSVSVDGLTLVVLDLQIAKTEAEVIQLESLKKSLGEKWPPTQEALLRNKQNALQDLRSQRRSLYARVIKLSIGDT